MRIIIEWVRVNQKPKKKTKRKSEKTINNKGKYKTTIIKMEIQK